MTIEEEILQFLNQNVDSGSLIYKKVESIEDGSSQKSKNVLIAEDFYTNHYTQSVNEYGNSVVNIYYDPSCTEDSKVMSFYFGSSDGFGANYSEFGRTKNSSDTKAIYSKINYMFDYNLNYKNVYAIEFQTNKNYDNIANSFFQINLAKYDGAGNLTNELFSFITSGSSQFLEREKYLILPLVSGSLATEESYTEEIGKINSEHNIIVFDADKLDQILNYNTNYSKILNAKNVNKFYNSFSESIQTSINNSTMPLISNAVYHENFTKIFIDINPTEFNYTNNPTFFDKETKKFRSNYTTAMQQVYFTTIGLYDSKYQLLAVAKLSRPFPKNFTEKYSFEITLDTE
jgi:hypothetical protein